MRALLAAILAIAGSASVALCQNNNYSSPSEVQSGTRQNHASLSLVPVSDSLSDAQRKAEGDSFSRVTGEKRSLSAPEPIDQRADDSEGRFWVGAESLFWKMKDANLPPLITAGPFPGPSSIVKSGIVGEPGTVIVFGGGKLDRGVFAGGRFTAGMWLNQKRNAGIELSYFFLPRRTYTAQTSASGLPGANVISRPFINSFSGQEDVAVVSTPLDFLISQFTNSGSSTGSLSSRLQGGEASFIYRFDRTGCCRLSLTGGLRYLDLDERLIVTDITDLNVTPGITGRTVKTDDFFTRNRFYGGQIGARSFSGWGRLSLEFSGTLALGANRQLVNINGSTVFGNSVSFSRVGSVLTQSSNIGSYRRSVFTIVPEARLSLGFDLTRFLRPFVSYDFLYWNKAVMTREQIDRLLNPGFLSGIIPPQQSTLTRPAFTFRDSVYRAMGLTTGVKVRF
jgi:hypothetical protein